jgi:hypothetical protein
MSTPRVRAMFLTVEVLAPSALAWSKMAAPVLDVDVQAAHLATDVRRDPGVPVGLVLADAALGLVGGAHRGEHVLHGLVQN